MIQLLEQSERLILEAPLLFTRYLMEEINWNNRLIGIKGARGTGKTTLLLQWLKQRKYRSSEALYLSLDDMYFANHSILETGINFYVKGGKVLALDEVHKYPGWAREIKNLYDQYKELKIIFTGSSIIDISRQEGDLSRRAMMYELHGLSYREFLKLNGFLHMKPLSLDELLAPSSSLREIFPEDFRPLSQFTDYLMHGYYPFYAEDPAGYYKRLQQMIRQIVEFDMAELKGFDIRNAKKMLQLIYIITQQVPFKPNLIKLAEKSSIHRNSISNYLHFLEEARLVSLLYPAGVSIATLQKPEKIFVNNTNLMYALAAENLQTGSIRETFFYNQLKTKHQVRQSKSSDFEIDNNYTFEVGGPSKSRKQIHGVKNSYLVKDNIEFPSRNSIPLWLFGFLY